MWVCRDKTEADEGILGTDISTVILKCIIFICFVETVSFQLYFLSGDSNDKIVQI